MKLFLDTANLEEIREAVEWGVIDGVTTNPTLIAKEIERTGKKRVEILKEICSLVDGPISAEGMSLDAIGIEKEGEDLARIHKNICIKVPTTPEGIKGMRFLRKKGIKVNATLVFSANQALLALKVGVNYISPFVGRVDDIGGSGMFLVEEILNIIENYNFSTQLIVASVRHPLHVVEAAKVGAHIATIPFKVLKQMINHPLTDKGVEKFNKDWEKVLPIIHKND